MTTRPLFTNNAATALVQAITPTDTVLQITAGTGSYFPSPTGGDYFMLTLIQINNPEVSEIVKCTLRVGDYLTVVRGEEGTQPQIFNISDNVELRITASSLNFFAGDNEAANIHFTPYSFVTATNVQNAIDQTVDQINANSTALSSSTGSSLVGYNEGGTGAVTRTVQSRLRDFVSVKDFGAVGNGSTDDTAAILAAITAVNAAGGGTVFFPQGTYIFPSNLTVTSFNNIVLQGAGQNATVLKSTIPAATPAFGTALFIGFVSCSNIAVKDITFNLNSILPTNSNCCAIGFTFGSHFSVDNCSVINGKQNGIGFNQCNDFSVTNCYLQRDGGPIGTYQNEAIICSAGAYQAVKNGLIANNIINGWGTIFSGINIIVAYNNISQWGYGAGITINADAYTNAPIIIGNVIRDSSGLDVNVTSPNGIECWAPQAIIQGNECYDNASSGIAFGGSFSVVTGNICGNNGNYNQHGNGIGMVSQAGWTAAQNCIVSNNTCFDTGTGNQEYGFAQSNATTATFANTQVFNNNFLGNTLGDVHFGTYSTQNQFIGYVYEASATYDFPSIANGTSSSLLNITTPGAALGDFVEVSCSISLQGLFVTGYVNATNAVQVIVSNLTGSAVDLGSATFRVRVMQHRP